ncbi:hypothetical protein BVJ53_11305 [Lacticaseibacillus chiayiensis]|uniref:Uncharacterized protein n=1 Tax=Lacticaseibacillus chiayiensis TaxID=2100821 RepID=A0A4Q1TMR4_9LACO|nr:hypothetical protein BVJ53_11305 [Lacticaseibacillus chiayiensis]
MGMMNSSSGVGFWIDNGRGFLKGLFDLGFRDTAVNRCLLTLEYACKDLGRNGEARAITPEATYTPISKRSCSRSCLVYQKNQQTQRIRACWFRFLCFL